jgi:hypothetical protein
LTNDLDFGISQNPVTKVYILVFNNKYYDYYCEECGNKYKKESNKWCKPCQIIHLKNNFINWTSGNEKIDDIIRKKQIRINSQKGIIFEWISYSEFIGIKEIGKDFTAIWKKGPLYYDTSDKKLIRKSYEKVCLKYLNNSQNDFVNKVLKFSINLD